MAKLTAGTYYAAAVSVSANGDLKPLPTTLTLTENDIVSYEFARDMKVLRSPDPIVADDERSFNFPTISMSQSFELTMTAEAQEFFENLFLEPEPPDHTFDLDSEGRVIVYAVFKDGDGNELAPPGWYYISLIDQALWRYAIRTGLQLEDAITEANRGWWRELP